MAFFAVLGGVAAASLAIARRVTMGRWFRVSVAVAAVVAIIFGRLDALPVIIAVASAFFVLALVLVLLLAHAPL